MLKKAGGISVALAISIVCLILLATAVRSQNSTTNIETMIQQGYLELAYQELKQTIDKGEKHNGQAYRLADAALQEHDYVLCVQAIELLSEEAGDEHFFRRLLDTLFQAKQYKLAEQALNLIDQKWKKVSGISEEYKTQYKNLFEEGEIS